MDQPMVFEFDGQALKAAREAKGWSQYDLARRTFLPGKNGARPTFLYPTRVSKYENGHNQPEICVAASMAFALDVPLASLLKATAVQ